MLRKTEVVASGSVDVIGKIDGKVNGVVISDSEIRHSAIRRCSTGFAACGYAGIETRPGAVQGQVIVNVLCSKPDLCANNDMSLQVGLDRLRESAPDPVEAKKG